MFRGACRGIKVLEERFGDSLKNIVTGTDRNSAYFAIDFLNNQICLSHLLRNLEYLNDIDNGQRRAKMMEQIVAEHIPLVAPADITCIRLY